MNANVTSAKSIQSGSPSMALFSPANLEEAMKLADMMSKSSIVPKDYQGNPGNVLIASIWGAEIGLPPLQAMQSIAVINGRPSIWGDAMLALVRASGLLEYIREDIGDNGATCTLKRRGEDEVVRTYTKEDAKIAGLLGKQGPWQTSPKRMLQMRARAFALRDVFTDVLRGVYVAEEAQDMPAEKDITAESEQIKEAPKSRAESVRAALADRRAETVVVPPISGPALAEVLEAISQAQNLEGLKAASEMAKALTGDAKTEARDAYKARKAALDATPGVTFAQVESNLLRSTDLEVLALAADLIGEVDNPTHREELTALYRKRVEELSAQPGDSHHA